MKRKINKYLLLISVCLIMTLIFTTIVLGRPFRLSKLPDEGKNFGCLTCHADHQSGNARNPFGQDWEKIAIAKNDTYTPELGKLDSDKDGSTNDAEFSAKTNPGDPNSKPSKQTPTKDKKSIPSDPKTELAKAINKGKALFNDTNLGKSGMSCNSCHPAGGTTGKQMMGMDIPSLKGAAATFPKFKTSANDVITLQQMQNICIQMMKGTPLKLDSNKSIALSAYVTSLSNGIPIQVGGK